MKLFGEKIRSRAMLTLIFAACLAAHVKSQVTVTATGGTANGSYATLKAAIDNINNGTHQGAVVIKVHGNTTESAAIIIDSSGNGGVTQYSSIHIQPADTATVPKVIAGTISGASLLTLQGADTVVIDGRPMNTGSARLLTFQNNGTTANSNGVTYINGAGSNVLTYVNVILGSRTVTNNCVFFSTSAATTANENNTVDHCRLSSCRTGVLIQGTINNPMENIRIMANDIFDFAYSGVAAGGVRNALIDSNSIYHTSAFSNTNPLACRLFPDCDAYSITVSRNRIFDLQTAAAAGIYGVYIDPLIASPAITPVVNCYNNYISLTQSSGSASAVYGISFWGANPVVARLINNSVRLGGTHTGGSANSVVSLCLLKANTSAATTFISRNNIFVNNRTGGTAGVFHSGFRIQTTAMVGTLDIDQNVYWATGSSAGNGPFPATWGNTLYPQAGLQNYINAAALVSPSLEANSLFNNVNFVSNTDLSLTGASVNNLTVMGCTPHALVPEDIFGTTRIYPTYKGAHHAADFTNRIDAAVQEIYSLGKLPVPYANPHEIRANIRNTGIDTLFNHSVSLNVAGVNPYMDVILIDTLLPGQAKIVAFTPTSYNVTGNDSITVSVPSDSTNSNNSKTFRQTTTTGAYAYAEPGSPAVDGVGYNGGSGDFVAKFPLNGSNFINQVGVNFFTGGQPFQIVVYSVVNDTPGTLLWNSQTYTSVTGVNTLPITPAIPVNGSFFIGVRQTGTTNVSFAYQNENPIRDKTFYYKATTVASWADFASTNSAFRFMIEPRLQVAFDLGIDKVEQPCAAVLQNGAGIIPQYRVNNYGAVGQSNFIVRSEITGPSAFYMTTADTIMSLVNGGETMLVSTNALFNPTVAGTYNIKVWTELGGDMEMNNDTATYSFVVATPAAANNSGNGLLMNGTNNYLSANGGGSLNINQGMLTLEAWVRANAAATPQYIISKDSSSLVPQYDLYINQLGQLVFRLNSINLGVDSIVAASTLPTGVFTHVAATYDGITMSLYQNGHLEATKLFGGFIAGNVQPLYIARPAFGTGYFSGTIDEVKIWDTCRTETQIRQNMHTRLGNAPHVSLKAYYRLDEGVGAYVLDASGNCNSALINNVPALVASNFPLGTPVVDGKTYSSSGSQTFAGTGVSIASVNQSGTNDMYVHRFAGTILGTSPVTSPGGVTSAFPAYWLIYRYGSGTMDSSEITFSLGGINASPQVGDFAMFNRANGDNAGWNTARNHAISVDFGAQTVVMGADSTLYDQQFAIGANNHPLPVRLLRFNGAASSADAILNWSTAAESNSALFIVERSADGKTFEEAGTVKAAGNSSSINNYGFTDRNAFASRRAVFYRLKQVDRNGSFSYTHTVLIQSGDIRKEQVTVYPNPVTSVLNIEIDALTNGRATVAITDITGKEVKTWAASLNEGFNRLELDDVTSLQKGVYLITVSSNGNVIYNDKLVKAE